jgi:exodeoxyribonuclease I
MAPKAPTSSAQRGKAVDASAGRIVWHDYETFGISASDDFPAQFAYVVTDFALNPTGEEGSFYCQPPPDYLPHPTACVLTGISPQHCLQHGLPEREFAARIHALFAAPGSVSAGYNSMRFDEEFTRQLLWRNFFPVYEREYQNNNARFDLIDLLRMAFALRPAGLQWPSVEGKPSFRLELLSASNGIAHQQAHEALSDVYATVALARRLRAAQPRLWEHAFALRKKTAVQTLLDVPGRTPLVHVSQRFAAEFGCLAIWQPICVHPERSNEIIGINLGYDVAPLLALGSDEISERLYIREADLPEGEKRVAIKSLHLNRAPMLAPLSVLQGCDHARIGLDLPAAMSRAAQIQAAPALAQTLRAVFAAQAMPVSLPGAARLYDGFAPDADRALCHKVRAADPALLAEFSTRFTDPRFRELLWRYRARQFPNTLSLSEQEQWKAQACNRLEFSAAMTFTLFRSEMEAARARALTGEQINLLDHLSAYEMLLAQSVL